jgi:hypothetical protein
LFVITGFRYNRVHLCSKMTNFPKKFVRYNRVFVITEFVTTEFYCIINCNQLIWQLISQIGKCLVKLSYCGLFSGSNKFLLLPSICLKMRLVSKMVKSDSKFFIVIWLLESTTLFVLTRVLIKIIDCLDDLLLSFYYTKEIFESKLFPK